MLSVLALGALLGLAMGMRDMSFREAQAFGRNDIPSNRANPAELIQTMLAVPLQTQVIFWVMVAAMLVLVAVLLSPEGRKRLLRALFRAVVTYWLLYFVFTRYPQVLARISRIFASSTVGPLDTSNGLPPPTFTPPPVASWTTYVASFGIVLLAAFLAWRAFAVWQRLHTTASDQPLHRLTQIARTSLHDLSSGRDSTDVILNCYFRMSDVVAEKQNINRATSMTPHEFARRLEQAGLPGNAVKQLTGLFESVRYGGGRSSPVMVREAVACLSTILQYCGEPL